MNLWRAPDTLIPQGYPFGTGSAQPPLGTRDENFSFTLTLSLGERVRVRAIYR